MIHLYQPRLPLAPFIDVFWLTENTFRSHGMERVLPTGTMQIIINLHDRPILTQGRGGSRERESINSSIVSGAHMDYLIIDTASIVSCLGIVFKPGGAGPFFPLPLTEIRNQRISLDALWGMESDFLREQLLQAETPRARFHTLECLMERKLHSCFENVRKTRPFISYTVEQLGRTPGETCLDRLKEQSGYATTRFIKLFSSDVGLTPKQFYRVQRFQCILNTLFSRQQADWTDLALQSGYFDQAHFIHEFKSFTGITPGHYFSKRIEDMNHLSL